MEKKLKPSKPDIFTYHDYISFLKDWFMHLRRSKTTFSMRDLAKRAGLATGYLPMILSGKRTMSEKAFQKIVGHLYLDSQEKRFLSLLRQVGESHLPEARITAVQQMGRMERFKKTNAKELQVYQYLTKWYYVAIREMVSLEGFKADCKWIQQNLNGRLSVSEVEEALEFLKSNGFIFQDEKGQWLNSNSRLDCREGIFKLSLGEFHRQMLELAADAVENVPRPERYILGHTVALSQSDFQKIRDILDEAISRVEKTGQATSVPESIYHVELAAFPLTRKIQDEEDL